MRCVLFLALVGLGFASFCENESADSLREIIKPMIISQVDDIFGHCRAFKRELRKQFNPQNPGACSAIFDEMYCFGEKKMNEYAQAENIDLTYNDMANFITEGGDGRMLGMNFCQFGRPCMENMVKTIAMCAKRDEGFWQTAIDVVEEKLSGDLVQGFIDSMLSEMSDDDPLKMIANAIRERVTSWDDLKAIIDEHIPLETQESMIEGAKERLHSFIRRAKGFCKSGCMGRSADYFEGAFSATHDEDTCPFVGVYGYCGGCQDNMEAYIEESEVPCCTQSAVVNIAESIISTTEKYYDLFKQKEAEVIEAISDFVDDDQIQTYNFVQKLIAEQAVCLVETYETIAAQECVAMEA